MRKYDLVLWLNFFWKWSKFMLAFMTRHPPLSRHFELISLLFHLLSPNAFSFVPWPSLVHAGSSFRPSTGEPLVPLELRGKQRRQRQHQDASGGSAHMESMTTKCQIVRTWTTYSTFMHKLSAVFAFLQTHMSSPRSVIILFSFLFCSILFYLIRHAPIWKKPSWE